MATKQSLFFEEFKDAFEQRFSEVSKWTVGQVAGSEALVPRGGRQGFPGGADGQVNRHERP
jgi:hypothetical protein